MENLFERCKEINDLLTQNKEQQARDSLIILLQELKDRKIKYTSLINHLIREVGLYPYINEETADWQDRFVCEAFKVGSGGDNVVTLHREQSYVLKALLNGEDLAISAPTSFGKSFIIDAFIEIKRPDIVVIIVPTLALTDETRRRLYKKFSRIYKIITTTGVELGKKNLFIFPQERALQYVAEIERIDLLIVVEFYKAGKIQGKTISADERTPQLIEAISQFGKKASQKYFLAPNISELKNNPLTTGMRFEMVDFNTVYTRLIREYQKFSTSENIEDQKYKSLERILLSTEQKSIIYVNSYSSIRSVTEQMVGFLSDSNKPILNEFSLWLKENYGASYKLSDLVKKEIGVHCGQLHRSLAQIQIKLFEQEQGLKNLVSTSSLIEGVNTSARNVIVWSKKRANSNFDYFTYKNIIGRSGRMFKHFVGNVFLLEEPPRETLSLLELDYPDSLLERVDPEDYSGELTPEQIAKIKEHETEMDQFLGKGGYRQVMKETASQSVSKLILTNIIEEMRKDLPHWKKCLMGLVVPSPQGWRNALFLMMPLLRKVKYFDGRDTRMVDIIQSFSHNWSKSIPELLQGLSQYNLSVEDYFELEKILSFDFVSLLQSINAIAKRIIDPDIDISSFIVKVSNAFLPPLVFELEEYGLPRMISRKIQASGLINLEREGVSINDLIEEFQNLGAEQILRASQLSSEIERFILFHFFDGITPGVTP